MMLQERALAGRIVCESELVGPNRNQWPAVKYECVAPEVLGHAAGGGALQLRGVQPPAPSKVAVIACLTAVLQGNGMSETGFRKWEIEHQDAIAGVCPRDGVGLLRHLRRTPCG